MERDATFLDGVFGERDEQPRTPQADQPASSGAGPRRDVRRPRLGQPAVLPTQRPPSPAAAPPATPPARPASPPQPAPVAPARTVTQPQPAQPPGTEPRQAQPQQAQQRPARPEQLQPQRPRPAAAPAGASRRPRAPREHRHRGDLLLVLLTCAVIALAIAVLTGSLGPLRGPSTATSPGKGAAPRPYLAAPPAALPATGTYQVTAIGDQGVVRVTQWIRSDTPLTTVRLIPTSGSGLDKARATDLVVAADRSRVPAPKTVTPSGRRITLPRPAKLVYLSYHLTGVMGRSASVKGRVLVRATAMPVGYHHRTGPSLVRVEATKILATACTDLALRGSSAGQPVSAPYPCGVQTPKAWTVKLTKKHRGASVSAQVELR